MTAQGIYLCKEEQKGQPELTPKTVDLRKCCREHHEGKVATTKNRGPFELIYCEGCINKEGVLTRERY